MATIKDERFILEKISDRLLSAAKTFFWFLIFYISIPFLIICYITVSISRSMWIAILSMKYPELEFIKTNYIRSTLDTQRNKGVIHVLLHVEGVCDIEVIKEKLFQYVLDRKDKMGKLCFPKLRTTFVDRWGIYAWKKNGGKFNVNNHVIQYPSTYRGRPITDTNVQEYVSTIVSKYIPSDIPQWQIHLIPCNSSSSPLTSDTVTESTESYYILTRIHHLILSQEPQLCLKDLLLLDSFTSRNATYDKSSLNNCNIDNTIGESLKNLLIPPVHIPKLYNSIMGSICNRWNEFIYNYDPLESSNCRKNVSIDNNNDVSIGIMQLLAIIWISCVTIMLDFYKGFHAVKTEPMMKLNFLHSLIQRELKKRQISTIYVVNTILFTLHPINFGKNICSITWWSCKFWTIQLPYELIKEITSCVQFCFGIGKGDQGYLIEYVPLLYNATIEFIEILMEILTAPRYIYEELFETKQWEQNALQNVSLCGRKIVAWSEKISVADVIKIGQKKKLSETELYFSSISAALNVFLEDFKGYMPRYLSVCTQYVGNEYLLSNKAYKKDVSSILCVKLPMQIPCNNQIKKLRYTFRTAREKQVSIFLLYMVQRRFMLLTKMLPVVWIQLISNYLTKKFPILITQIEETGHNPIVVTLWGHKILDALYFMPTQSNIGITLTLQHYGDYIRLSLMTDAQLNPLHSKITQSWASYLNDIIGSY